MENKICEYKTYVICPTAKAKDVHSSIPMSSLSSGQPCWHRWPLRCPSQLCPGKGLGGWAHPILRVVLVAAICTLNLLKMQFAIHC